jgi:glutathione S-transferase
MYSQRMRRLIGEDFSPWTEKARWALDHHAVEHSFTQYQPLLFEPWLRWKSRNLTGKPSVPVLLAEGEVITDSFAIARFAERVGDGASLFPAGCEAEIEAWNARSDRALRAARALFFTRLVEDPEAQSDNLPPFVPERVRPFLRPMVKTGVAYLRAKYGADRAFTERASQELQAELVVLRQKLAERGRYLLGSFSYADVAMAVVCQFFSPVEDRYIRLAAANRRCWTEESLAQSFEDVVKWRDALYAQHRQG